MPVAPAPNAGDAATAATLIKMIDAQQKQIDAQNRAIADQAELADSADEIFSSGANAKKEDEAKKENTWMKIHKIS